MRTKPLSWPALIVFVTALASANAPGDQYDLFSSSQSFITDPHTKLEWQRYATPKWMKVDHLTAQSTCATATSSTGGKYRLPTVRELLTLVDEDLDNAWDPEAGATVPTHIDPNAFPTTPSDVFWTMSPGTSQAGYFKVVNFGTGETGELLGTDLVAYVRCTIESP